MNKSWSKSTRYIIAMLLLVATIWLTIFAIDLIEAIAISALLAYILNPLVTFVHTRAKVSRTWIVWFVYLFSLAGLVAIGIVFIPLIPEQTANLISELQVIVAQIQADYLSAPIVFMNIEIPINDLIPDISAFSPNSSVRTDIILDAIETTTTNVGWLAVILVSTFYLLQDWARLRQWLSKWIPKEHDKDARHLYEQIALVWNQYFRGQFRLSLIVGTLTGIGAALVGLPGAVIFGILAGIFDVLLSVGPLIITGVAALVALFGGSAFLGLSNVAFMLVVVAIFSVIQVVENVWLRPRIMGQSLNLHPAIVFIAIITSLALTGILTALIVIPMVASTAVIIRYLHAKIFELDPWTDLHPKIVVEQSEE